MYGIHGRIYGIHGRMYGFHSRIYGIHSRIYGTEAFHLECGGRVKYCPFPLSNGIAALPTAIHQPSKGWRMTDLLMARLSQDRRCRVNARIVFLGGRPNDPSIVKWRRILMPSSLSLLTFGDLCTWHQWAGNCILCPLLMQVPHSKMEPTLQISWTLPRYQLLMLSERRRSQ